MRYILLRLLWNRIPTKTYGSCDVKLPAFAFVAMLALIIPLPLAMFYSEADAFLVGMTLFPLWITMLTVQSTRLRLRSPRQSQSTELTSHRQKGE